MKSEWLIIYGGKKNNELKIITHDSLIIKGHREIMLGNTEIILGSVMDDIKSMKLISFDNEPVEDIKLKVVYEDR